MLTYLAKIKHITSIGFIDLIFSVILTVESRIHIEKLGTVELNITVDRDEHEKDDDFELVSA